VGGSSSIIDILGCIVIVSDVIYDDRHLLEFDFYLDSVIILLGFGLGVRRRLICLHLSLALLIKPFTFLIIFF